MDRDFRIEAATFERRLPELLEQAAGHYAAIVGDQVLGTFEDAGDAWRAGLHLRPDGDVFVQRVRREPEVVMLPMQVLPVGTR